MDELELGTIKSTRLDSSPKNKSLMNSNSNSLNKPNSDSNSITFLLDDDYRTWDRHTEDKSKRSNNKGMMKFNRSLMEVS